MIQSRGEEENKLTRVAFPVKRIVEPSLHKRRSAAGAKPWASLQRSCCSRAVQDVQHASAKVVHKPARPSLSQVCGNASRVSTVACSVPLIC